ncbi:biliverdin-producing heme oxygenase [Pararhizobium sp.]|uniref:biliverdin-producing heme oxygenase n=1 Tax=Pararhizobium sp. TaxID=1977563 RepID=UPI00271E8393|nr:biliverdin-producing heme oxygenase [Pararhizobium sp.]MDO9418753.1 biliverdin-producing heme oxygenase [Pararhizobium sp.]
MTLRTLLRSATGSFHERVDAAYGRFDLSDRADYRHFLSAHARVLPAMELALERGGIGSILPDWPARRRREALLADMDALDIELPPPAAVRAFAGPDQLWGAAYVLEGSKMGGAMLARSVGAGLPSRYLGMQGPKGSMKLFMDALDRHICHRSEDAVEAARSVFNLFEVAARAELEQRVS